jgi:hypothetical protein
MKLKHLTTSALALILMSACSDSTGLEVDDLTGTWTASSIVFTSVADPTVSADMVADEGATLTLTLGAEATYTLILTIPQEETEDEAGTYVVSGSTLTLSQTGEGSPEAFTISRDGDTMTLTDNDEEFDFDEEDDAEGGFAPLRFFAWAS